MESKLNQLPKSPTKEDVLTLLASATNLNWLANYIERNKGQSFKTATLWQESKGSLKKGCK